MNKFKFVITVAQVSAEYKEMCSYHKVEEMETPYFLEVKTIEAPTFIKAEMEMLEYVAELFGSHYYLGEVEIGLKGTANAGYKFKYDRERYEVANRFYMEDLGDLEEMDEDEELLPNHISEEDISAVLKTFLHTYANYERGDGSDDIAITINKYLEQHKGEKIFFDVTADFLMETVGNYRADSVDDYINEALRQLECSRLAIKNLKIGAE